MPDRTELTWTYEPRDFFEAAYECCDCDFDLVADDGRLVVRLRVPQGPLPQDLRHRIRAYVDALFAARRLRDHRQLRHTGPTVYQHEGDRAVVCGEISGGAVGALICSVDGTVVDGSGNVLWDTKVDRIAAHAAELDSLAPKMLKSPTLRSLVESHSHSIDDPANELVHLYEIRDALRKHYGGERAARGALGIAKPEWNRLGALANDEPLRQGRHRGEHLPALRDASASELEEARSIAKRWILLFAQTL